MIEKVLEELGDVDGVEGLILVTKDGLPRYSTLIDNKNIVSMMATIFGTAEAAIAESTEGIPHTVNVYSERGVVILRRAGQFVLVVVVNLEIDINLISIEIARTAKIIKENKNN